MPVETFTPHPHYDAAATDWMQCRDVIGGSKAVKARGEVYLPRLSGQTNTEYAAYKLRALFYNGTARTREALIGTAFRKPPVVVVPSAIEAQFADVTLADTPFEVLAIEALGEELVVGRYGVLLDMHNDTVEVAKRRPYWVPFTAEQILDWDTAMLDGDEVLTYVVLREYAQERQPDGSFEQVRRYRVLRLDQGIYTIEKFRQGKDDKLISEGRSVPVRRGTALPFIPFLIVGPTAVSPCVAKPPLLDMADVNLSHYRTSADHEHGLHFVALPTPWVVGAKKGGGTMRIGSGVAWQLEGPDAKAGFLEFTGQGLGALTGALDKKEELMAILGARLIEGKSTGQAETAEAVRSRNAATHATLKTIATMLSHAFTKLARWHAWWTGVTENTNDEAITISLNREFFDAKLTSEEAKALLLMVQAGKLSFETFYHRLQQGEWTRPDVDVEQERHDIDADPSNDPTADPADGDPDGDPGADPSRRDPAKAA